MALPKIDFDQNDHDHFDHDTGASKFGFGRKMCHMVPGTLLHGGNYKSANLRSCKKPTICRMDGDEGQVPLCCNATHSQGVFSVCLCVILSVCCDKVA